MLLDDDKHYLCSLKFKFTCIVLIIPYVYYCVFLLVSVEYTWILLQIKFVFLFSFFSVGVNLCFFTRGCQNITI